MKHNINKKITPLYNETILTKLNETISGNFLAHKSRKIADVQCVHFIFSQQSNYTMKQKLRSTTTTQLTGSGSSMGWTATEFVYK